MGESTGLHTMPPQGSSNFSKSFLATTLVVAQERRYDRTSPASRENATASIEDEKIVSADAPQRRANQSDLPAIFIPPIIGRNRHTANSDAQPDDLGRNFVLEPKTIFLND